MVCKILPTDISPPTVKLPVINAESATTFKSPVIVWLSPVKVILVFNSSPVLSRIISYKSGLSELSTLMANLPCPCISPLALRLPFVSNPRGEIYAPSL